ncbi:hypothetical protein LIER_37903 [Lithospermum erythrorhizon]|uniref:Uncharacterized protein n=1 Tax=Lithospermum erythrorhizon TaxID=34254 RepID=A0AAV3PW14_LITER
MVNWTEDLYKIKEVNNNARGIKRKKIYRNGSNSNAIEAEIGMELKTANGIRLDLATGRMAASDKVLCTLEMPNLKPISQSPILNCGDLNHVLFNSEKLSCPTETLPGSLNFLHFLDKHGIEDLPHTGCKFSWSGIKSDITIFEKLDRAMGNYEVASSFPSSICQGLPIQRSIDISLRNQLDLLLKSEEDYWRQRSKLTAITEGDNNTNFFHSHVKHTTKTNSIIELRDVSSTLFIEEGEIRDHYKNFFANLFNPTNHTASQIQFTTP